MADTANTGAALPTSYLATGEYGLTLEFVAARDAPAEQLVAALTAALNGHQFDGTLCGPTLANLMRELAWARGWEIVVHPTGDGQWTIWTPDTDNIDCESIVGDSHDNQDCMDSSDIERCRDCERLENCWDMRDSYGSRNCGSGWRVNGCDNVNMSTDVDACKDCDNCYDCWQSEGLRDERYVLRNVQLTPSQYHSARYWLPHYD